MAQDLFEALFAERVALSHVLQQHIQHLRLLPCAARHSMSNIIEHEKGHSCSQIRIEFRSRKLVIFCTAYRKVHFTAV